MACLLVHYLVHVSIPLSCRTPCLPNNNESHFTWNLNYENSLEVPWEHQPLLLCHKTHSMICCSNVITVSIKCESWQIVVKFPKGPSPSLDFFCCIDNVLSHALLTVDFFHTSILISFWFSEWICLRSQWNSQRINSVANPINVGRKIFSTVLLRNFHQGPPCWFNFDSLLLLKKKAKVFNILLWLF